MKNKRTLAYGFFAVVLVLTLTACPPDPGGGQATTRPQPDLPGYNLDTLAGQLARLRANARSGGEYTIEISRDTILCCCDSSLPSGRSNLTIILRGSGAMRTISLNDNDSLFTIGSGVTLVLDDNITLQGRPNNNPLVIVNDYGTLIMNDGARITGNTNSSWNAGGGVRVNSSGTFEMHGGEISGNAAIGSWANGGGIHIASGGTFRISNGIIHGNDAAEGLRNTATGYGAVLFNSGTAEHGTFYNGTFTYTGTLTTTNYTVRVVNGVRHFPTMEGTLAEQLAWLRNFAQSGNAYTIELNDDATISPEQTLPTGRTNLTITLMGIGAMRTINLYDNGILFTVGSGVTLVLDDNITLQGRPNNNNPLMIVNDYGTLIMNDGARTTGNTNTSSWWGVDGGGIRVNSGGTFEMHGGEILGNSTTGDWANGGGIHIASGGTFRISNGIIHGNDAAEGLRNTATGYGAVLFNSGTAEHGTFYNGTFTYIGTLISTNGTIEVIDGAAPREYLRLRLVDLQTTAGSGGHYTIEISHNQNLASHWLSFPGRSNVTVTLRGIGEMHTVNLSDNGSLFSIGFDVTLVLGGNITLQGWHGNCCPLVNVDADGTFIVNEGARITGNTGGGGVRVNSGGVFILNDGEISGNSTAGSGGGVHIAGGRFYMHGGEVSGNFTTGWDAAHGGGVHIANGGWFDMHDGTISSNAAENGGGVSVDWNGIFRISNGLIYGNESAAPVGLRNTVRGSGAALSGTAQHGMFDGAGVFALSGNLSTQNNTIRVVNGDLWP